MELLLSARDGAPEEGRLEGSAELLEMGTLDEKAGALEDALDMSEGSAEAALEAETDTLGGRAETLLDGETETLGTTLDAEMEAEGTLDTEDADE
jgi:hypothetical protein